MKTTDEPIIVEETFNCSKEKVWSAITDASEMTQWFFDNIPDFQPEVGFKTQFVVKNEERTFTHMWEVTEVIPLQKISYTWTYPEYPGDAVVHFTLQEKGDKTKLRLTMNITEDFPQHIPEFKRESCIGGWNYFINENLKNYLKSK